MKKKKSKKIILIISVILMLVVAGWWVFTIVTYNENFNLRFSTYEPTMFRIEDFEGLSRTRYEFPSDKGQKLVGYMYRAGEGQRGIIVIAHGFGGGGHNSYMDCIDFFAKNGYLVFAYDATGNDESDGDGVGGVPQGVADLDYAVSFVENSGNFPELPVFLFGHSWGAYSVCNVLTYHPEVKAVIECCGCNRSSDLFEGGGRDQAGILIYTMTPFVRLHEWIKYGKYATNTALDGFEASKAHVMCVHSADDEVVPIGYGYDKYYEKYKDDPRFVFVRYENKGHNNIFNDHNNTYVDELNAGFDKWLTSLGYDYKDEANKERFKKDKAEYLNEHLDRARWADRLDKEMFKMFIEFYDSNL